MDEVAIGLAKFWGWYLIIFCSILLINTKRVVRFFALLESEKYLVLVSFIAILLGLVSVILHNVWELNWKLLITLFGWITLIKGIINLIFPKTTIKAFSSINIRYLPILYSLLFLIGVLLLNQAYQIVPY